MVAVKERENMTDSIEQLLTNYCRTGCPHYAQSKLCNNKCPIGMELLEYGKRLGADEKRVNNKWSEEDEQRLIDLRMSGKMYKEIGPIIGRTQYSVDKKVRDLRSEGRLP